VWGVAGPAAGEFDADDTTGHARGRGAVRGGVNGARQRARRARERAMRDGSRDGTTGTHARPERCVSGTVARDRRV